MAEFHASKEELRRLNRHPILAGNWLLDQPPTNHGTKFG